MPVVGLRYKQNRGLESLVEKMAQALPAIVAPQLTVTEWPLLEEHIIVEVTEGSRMDVNAMDLHVKIPVHNFSDRLRRAEESKENILKGIRAFLADYDRNVEGFVSISFEPTAYGRI